MSKHHSRPDHDVAADHRVALLLAAAAAPAEAGCQPGEAAAVAAFRRTVAVSAPAPTRVARRAGLVAGLSALLLLGGGMTAAAVSGSLPAPAQDQARSWLSQVGVDVPGGGRGTTVPVDASKDEHTDEETSPEGDAAKPAEGSRGHDADRPEAAAKGEEVSSTARDPELHGRDKGAAVSGLASGGTSQVGEHGGGDGRPELGDPAPAVDAPAATPSRPLHDAPARRAHPRTR